MRYNFIDMTGKKFGRLTVIKRGNNFRGRVRWWCKCDCGKEGYHSGWDLRSGLAKSCRCLFKEMKKESNKENIKAETPLNTLFYRYKRNAHDRLLNFNLSFKNFKKIISQRCFYCGDESQQTFKTDCHSFKYNGIDRVDNNKGYIAGDVVPCCKKCNFSKTSMSQHNFFQWIERLYKNLKITKRI